jgi:predicted hydrocarbon binding protein
METELEGTLKENLSTLSALTAALSKASGKLLGRSANSIMYLSGSDMGKEEGQKLDRTDDLAQAVELAMNAELGGWHIELWQDADQANLIVNEEGFDRAWIIFRECPVRQVCLAHDVPMGEALCQLSHGYFAGVMSQILDKKVDLHLEHAGINVCKKQLRLRGRK